MGLNSGLAGLLAVALLAVPAIAQDGQSPGPGRDQGVTTAKGVDVRFQLPHAIQLAEREGKGRATFATLTPFSRGGGALEVTVMRADKSIVKYHVDANTGEVVNATEQTVEAIVSSLDPAALGAQQFTMSKAIEAAEAHVKGGVAIGAEVEKTDGGVAFEVSVLKDGAETDLVVTPDGKVEEN